MSERLADRVDGPGGIVPTNAVNPEAGCNVLVVGGDQGNQRRLASVLRRGDLVPRLAASGAQALQAAALQLPDLMLLDVALPSMSGLEVCRRFKADDRLRGVPIIFTSGQKVPDQLVEAFRAGAVDYVTRPFEDEEVLERILTHLRLGQEQTALHSQAADLGRQVAEQVQATTASQFATIYALATLLETRDLDTGHHIERVQSLTRVLAEQMRRQGLHPDQITPAFVDDLEQAAALHDIGKVGTPDAVLLKPAALTSGEFEEMKQHCMLGARTLTTVLKRHPESQFLQMGADVARSHHERWDGQGYPEGLAGEAIPLVARIVAVADFYDAMTSTRVYRAALAHQEACALIRRASGSHFDPVVVGAFEAVEEESRRIATDLRG
jgi:putative two-component system response regulator